jgi:hypothetical protein
MAVFYDDRPFQPRLGMSLNPPDLRPHLRRPGLPELLLGLGALGVLATGADHLEEYTVNHFSTVPTIGTLFLLNFLGATLIGIGLLLPLRRITGSRAEPVRAVLAVSGIALAASSLVGLWISEQASLFGFSDHGYRPAIIAAIVAESVAIMALSAYLALTSTHRLRARPS